MADSIEQKLVTRCLEVLASIASLGSTVVNGSTVPSIADSRPNWEQNELPAISVFQGQVEVEDRDDEAQKVLRKLPLIIRGYLERGTDAASARTFLVEIQTAIRSASDNWEVAGVPLALYTDEGSHSIEYAEGSYEITGVEQLVDIYYSGSKFDLEA